MEAASVAESSCAENSKTVSLVYPDHGRKLVDGLWQLLSEKEGVDLELACHGTTTNAHQVVLSLFVPVIRQSIRSASGPDPTEDSKSQVASGDDKTMASGIRQLDLGHLVDAGSDLQLLVEFVYRGQVDVLESQLDSLLRTADVLGVTVLPEAVREMRRKVELASRAPETEVIAAGNGGRGRRKRKRTSDKLADDVSAAAVPSGSARSSRKCAARATGAATGLRRSGRNEVLPVEREPSVAGSDDGSEDVAGGRGEPTSLCSDDYLNAEHDSDDAGSDEVDDDDERDTDYVRERRRRGGSKAGTRAKRKCNSRTVDRRRAADSLARDSEVEEGETSIRQSLACLASVETRTGSPDSESELAADRLASCLKSEEAERDEDDVVDGGSKSQRSRAVAATVAAASKDTLRQRMAAPAQIRGRGRPFGSKKTETSGDGGGRRLRFPRRLRRSVPLVDRNMTFTTNEYKKLWRQSQPLLKCSQCDYETRDKVTFKSHLARHDPSVALFQCNTCEKRFRSKKGFELHEQSHLGMTDSFKCPHCESVFTQRGSLSRHVTGVHKIDSKGHPLHRTHSCEHCDFTCQYSSLLKLHILRKHSVDKPFKCSECPNYSTVLKSDLDKHVSIVHLKLRTFLCDDCGYCSTHQGALNRHKRTHTDLKPYQCTICGQEYADSHKLKMHLRRHVCDDRPFFCHICAQQFFRRDNLQMHLKRIHRTTLDNQALANETLTNQTLSNEALANRALANEALANDVLANEVLAAEALANETLEDEVLLQ